MKQFKKILKTSMTAIAFIGLTATSANAANLRLAHNLSPSSPQNQSFEYMAEKLHEISDGKMRLRIYPSSQMGGSEETVPMLQSGALDMTTASGNFLETIEKSYGVFTLPFVFEDNDHFENVLFSDITKDLMAKTEDRGFIGLGSYSPGQLPFGARNFISNTPIRTPEDLQGMKIRVQSSPSYIEMIRLMGGAPTPIPFGETFSAMQQGVVDATTSGILGMTDMRYVEVGKYMSMTEHVATPDFLLISNRSWNRLNDQQQQWLSEAVRKSEQRNVELLTEIMEEARKQVLAEGGEFIEADREAFRNLVLPMIEEFRKDEENAQILDKILEAA